MQPIGTIGAFSPVIFEIEPSENDEVLYQKVAPRAQGETARAMVYFTLRAHNQTENTLTARELTVSFPGSAVPSINFPSRDVVIGSGKDSEVGLLGGEELELPGNVPDTIRISMVFDGLAQPIAKSWPLVPHAKTYAFFARPETDPDYGEFLIMPGNHMGGGGGQHFGYDVSVLGVNQNGDLSESKTGSTDNADRFLWERPIYAMADGIVVRAVDEHPDNPSPDERAFARKSGSYQGTTEISAVAVANLSRPANDELDLCRMFVATVSNGNLAVRVLQQNADGSELNSLSSTSGPSADGGVSVAGISETSAVTAHDSGGGVRLALWSIAADGSPVSMLDDLQLSGLTDAKVVKLASRRVAILARTSAGNLSLTIREWSNAGQFGAGNIGSASGGLVGAFDMVRLSATRLAAAVQTGDDRLKVIVWDVGIGGDPGDISTGSLSVTRVGEADGQGTISELALAAKDGVQIATAVRTSDGLVKLIVWDVLESGAVLRRGDITGEEGTGISVSFFKTKTYAVAYRIPNGKLRIVAWEANQDENTQDISISQIYQRDTDGTTEFFAMTLVPSEQPTLVTALRTHAGVLKVILWQFTDSNLIYILHGDEIVSFVHLREGSVPNNMLSPGTTVNEGEMIGRMGHSGKSGGPHLHIHAIRVHPELLDDMDALIADLASGKDVGTFRPLHFRDVRAMRSNSVEPGWDNNPMSLLDGEGTYFDTYVVWPWPGHAQQVTAPGKRIVK